MIILGVDIGGTFTDFVLMQNGTVTIHKLPTTTDDPSRALLDGVAQLGMPDLLIHGTTIATNALLERRGATTALLTTAGFADVLIIGRGIRPALYDLTITQPPPIVPDHLRLEVPERMGYDGAILQPLEESALTTIVHTLRQANVESVAICLLHSYANAAHEQRLADLLAAERHTDGTPRFFVCASSDVMPEYREYERTSTTVVNAYVAPILDRYLQRIEHALETTQTNETTAPHLHIMASDGGSMTTRDARQLAARTTLSGPAGGVVGALAVARQAGIERIISFDMGGTSTDVALCDGTLPQTTESAVGGFPVRFPAIAIHTVGAGGGSLARSDAGGALRVGPQSAGAVPGPACYGRGGTQPTVTDANLLLGRLRSDYFLDGGMVLDSERAAQALAPLAESLHLAPLETAMGIVRIANAAMERAIRTISVERGRDPRDFTLVAFGGAGPLHAAYLADLLGMRRVLVPRYPGVLSALGMITADMSRDYLHFLAQPLADLTPALVLHHMHQLVAQAQAETTQQHTRRQMVTLRAMFSLDMRYMGQSHEIPTPLAVWEGDEQPAPDCAALAERFHQLHRQYSGHALYGHPLEVVALRLKWVQVRSQKLPDAGDIPSPAPTTAGQPAHPYAQVEAALATDTTQMHPTLLYQREHLHAGDRIASPAIIVQLDTTTVVPPGWGAWVDGHGNVVLGRGDD